MALYVTLGKTVTKKQNSQKALKIKTIWLFFIFPALKAEIIFNSIFSISNFYHIGYNLCILCLPSH